MVGSFLSGRSGTHSISEKLALYLNDADLILRLVSFRYNKLLRILDIAIVSLLGKYDKIHIDTFSGPAFKITSVALTIARWRKKKVILTLRGGKLPDFYNDSPGHVKGILLRADYIQTPSLYLKEFFKNQGVLANYLPNFIDLERFPYSRENIKPQSILWVRAFTEIYNPGLAINALYEVRRRYPDATLTMIGPDKGLLAESKKLINKLGLNSSVTITGPVPNELLYTYYQSHEVFINTTSYESFGVAVLEAAACGIPVVSSKVGEIPFLWVNEEDMLIVDSLDESKFANEILRLFANNNLANKISTNARKKAENFDMRLILGEWKKLFA